MGPFGTVWNRFGVDRRKMPLWVPLQEFYGVRYHEVLLCIWFNEKPFSEH